MTGGKIGELFTSLAFAAALVSTLSFLFALFRPSDEKRGWSRIGKIAFGIHAGSVLAIIVTLFLLILNHDYRYHYVWAHSSNELPVHFMISCFWEGQEGSFLLWIFWHALLGLVVMRTGGEWKEGVLAIMASVQVILLSMILGVYVSEDLSRMLFVAACLAPPLAALGIRVMKRNDNAGPGMITTGAVIMGLMAAGFIISGRTGFWTASYPEWTGADQWTYLLALLLTGGLVVYGILHPFVAPEGKRAGIAQLMVFFWCVAMVFIAAKVPFAAWKIGSSPFVLLKDAMTNAPVFAMNPDFVPANGNGLNPLLQNYWMVIHPPTLFLGFAATLVPFSYVTSALILRKYTEWIRPASPWLIFSAMVLGVGIIMGGYWAYETLSFGGYWNWDPVENASFVPWLTGIAALHGVLAYRKSRSFLGLSMGLVIITFILVLYSTFLTRSSILGEASVHAFTDLGLMGQLLLLLLAYFGFITLLFAMRLKEIPSGDKNIPFWSAEFFLFLGSLVFIFSSLGITLATSLPVINKIFGTTLAPPAAVQFFYYRWNVWFAVLIGVLSGMGQFLYWFRLEKRELLKSMFRPFLAGIISASVVLILIALVKMRFVYDAQFTEWIRNADFSADAAGALSKYMQFIVYAFADEILLAASLFTVFANLDIMIHLVSKKETKIRVMGGSIAHIGFGLMLAGILFSSGYDEVVSRNLRPDELTLFDEKERNDNVLLVKNKPRLINGYEVTYTGKKEAVPPVGDIRILEQGQQEFRVRFRDRNGEIFALKLPAEEFLLKSVNTGNAIDTSLLRRYLDERVAFIRPNLINSRSLYGVQFVKAWVEGDQVKRDTSDKFVLYPEAEINPGMGLIAHPSRKIFLNRDLYVHVSSIPKEEKEPEFDNQSLELSLHDSVPVSGGMLILEAVTGEGQDDTYELIVRADLEYRQGSRSWKLHPRYRITRQNEIHPGVDFITDEEFMITFVHIDPEKGKMGFVVQKQKKTEEDFIVLKAIHKPWINILWLGTFILVAGFGIAIYRRIKENE